MENKTPIFIPNSQCNSELNQGNNIY